MMRSPRIASSHLSYGPKDRDAYHKTLVVEVKGGKWTVVKSAK